MIVLLKTKKKKKKVRIKLYKDDVFLIAHETIKKLMPSLSIEELFASADQFAFFLLDNDISKRGIMQYEIDDLREEFTDEKTFYLLLSLSYVKLCALRKTRPNAKEVVRALVGFCQEYDGFTDLLRQFNDAEKGLDKKRVDLLTYDLNCMAEDGETEDDHALVASFVEVALGLSVDGMQHVENTLSEVNDKLGHRFQKELNCLREARKKKSESINNIETMFGISGNQNVNIGGM